MFFFFAFIRGVCLRNTVCTRTKKMFFSFSLLTLKSNENERNNKLNSTLDWLMYFKAQLHAICMSHVWRCGRILSHFVMVVFVSIHRKLLFAATVNVSTFDWRESVLYILLLLLLLLILCHCYCRICVVRSVKWQLKFRFEFCPTEGNHHKFLDVFITIFFSFTFNTESIKSVIEIMHKKKKNS